MPMTRRRRSRPLMAPTPSSCLGDSNDEAGMQEGAITKTSRGSASSVSSSQWTPSEPSTLPISWGSATMAVVPRGTTARVNWSGVSFDDSMCTWASMKPGTRYAPSSSITCSPSYRPRPTTWPSRIATSTSNHSRVKTEKTREPRNTTSGVLSPRATASQRAFIERTGSGADLVGSTEAHRGPPLVDRHQRDANESGLPAHQIPQDVPVEVGAGLPAALRVADPDQPVRLHRLDRYRTAALQLG